MISGEKVSKAHIFIVLNPVAGNASAQEIQEIVQQHFDEQEWSYEIYETTGKENLAEITKKACTDGADLVIAAGGDGTVAGVVNGIVKTGIPLGILPAGTGNGLARALGIPLSIPEAMDLIYEKPTVMAIDAMQVKDEYYILNVSAGISARAMRETGYEQKRRFGLGAYVVTIVKQLFGFQPRRFEMVIDGVETVVNASEILVSNGELLKERPFPMGPRERFCDGKFNVYIVTAHTAFDYVNIMWTLIFRNNERRSDLHTLVVEDKIRIESAGRPQPVQADGEVIGMTPVEVIVAPQAINVIVATSQA